MKDFFEEVENRYNRMYSYGGETERKFFQNVGKIVNKKAVYERSEKSFEEVMKKAEEVLNGGK